MKGKTIIQIVLGVAIVVLGYCLYSSIVKPMKFDDEFQKRRAACAEKLKVVRSLEEAYKTTYGCYCASFDTMILRLTTEDSMRVVNKSINYDKIPADVDINEMTEMEAMKAGYISRVTEYVNPIAQLRSTGKLKATDEEIRDCRYVPYPRDKKYEFHLDAGFIEKSGYQMPVFECKVDMADLLSDMDHQLVINKLDELEKQHKFLGWKVGDMTQSITDGNFE